jgi:hypothetical protein
MILSVIYVFEKDRFFFRREWRRIEIGKTEHVCMTPAQFEPKKLTAVGFAL